MTVDPEGHSGTTKNATFTVTLSSASTQTVSVTYATANGTATAGTTADYTAVAPTTLTFSPGQTSKTITVPVTGDNADEANETFRVNLSAPTGGTTIADNQGTGSIIDDDPHLKITDATVTEGHSGTTKNAVFTVTLSSPSSGTVTVKYATTSGTATATTDYTTTTGTLTFAAGQVTKTISVPIKGDNTDESTTAETFTVTLSAPTGGATIADATGAGKITDDDPHFKINDVTVIEGDSGTKTVTFTVTMTSSSKSYSVNFATANNTASSSSDYTAKTGTLTFAAGQTSKTIAITVRGDTTDEGNERFYVNLSSPTGGATLADGRGYGNITDDDP